MKSLLPLSIFIIVFFTGCNCTDQNNDRGANCLFCVSDAECVALLGNGWECVDECCVEIQEETDDDSYNHDDDDEDDDTGDDDDNFFIPDAKVNVDDPPEGNLLARKITVITDQPCSLSGYVTTAGERAYGPSDPTESDHGKEHVFWFYGLFESRAFKYTFYLTNKPGKVVATGTFSTPALPDYKPEILDLAYDEDNSFTDWYLVYHHFPLGKGQAKFNYIFDRKGRLRMYHHMSGGKNPKVMSNGHIVSSKYSELVALKLDGEEYTLIDIQLDQPFHVESHHKFYLEDYDSDWAMVIFARKGDGVECDLSTPTTQMVGDGIAEIDGNGNEVWRWDVFDHQDQIPQTAMDPEICELHFWGSGTYDWTHANSVIPVPGENGYIFSLRNVSRLVKIDRDTGDILWQMGQGLDFSWIGGQPADEKWFHFQHDPHLLADGRFFIYDNSFYPNAPFSRAMELLVDQNAMTVELLWEYRVPYHRSVGNIRLHENGNILIGAGDSLLVIELPPGGQEGDELFYMEFSKGLVKPEYYPALWIKGAPPGN